MAGRSTQEETVLNIASHAEKALANQKALGLKDIVDIDAQTVNALAKADPKAAQSVIDSYQKQIDEAQSSSPDMEDKKNLVQDALGNAKKARATEVYLYPDWSNQERTTRSTGMDIQLVAKMAVRDFMRAEQAPLETSGAFASLADKEDKEIKELLVAAGPNADKAANVAIDQIKLEANVKNWTKQHPDEMIQLIEKDLREMKQKYGIGDAQNAQGSAPAPTPAQEQSGNKQSKG